MSFAKGTQGTSCYEYPFIWTQDNDIITMKVEGTSEKIKIEDNKLIMGFEIPETGAHRVSYFEKK